MSLDSEDLPVLLVRHSQSITRSINQSINQSKHIYIVAIHDTRYLGADTLKELFENVESRNIVALLKIQTFIIVRVYNVFSRPYWVIRSRL